MYHWQTKNYARHIATDNLHTKISASIDKFVEAYQEERRVKIEGTTLKISNFNEKSGLKLLKDFQAYLIGLKLKRDDLENIREEMLADVNQTLYLFTLE